MLFDTDLAQRVKELNERGVMNVSHAEWVEFARECFGIWTVSLAAHAAGATEKQTVAALLNYHCPCGSSVVCRGIAENASS